MFSLKKVTLTFNNVERYLQMRKKKNIEEKEFEKQLSEVEFTDCDDGQSKRENEMIDLLKNIVNQNSQIIQLLTKLKERFV